MAAQTGALQDGSQTNCPASAPCAAGPASCACPDDADGDAGTLINRLAEYQCAYATGACEWGSVSAFCLCVCEGRC